MKTTDTPESDAAWDYAWDEGGCNEGHLLDTMQKLERERDEARKLAEIYRDNDHDLTLQNSINNPSKPLLPWENAEHIL